MPENIAEVAAVDFADETIALGNVGRQGLIIHVQFRQVYLQL